MGTNVWNATETNWLDAADLPVAWQPGAEAHFTGAGDAIQLETDVSATNLAFTGSGYTLLGAGRLTLEGTVTAAEATANGIAADLLSAAGIAKTGAGTLTLSAPSAALAAPLAVSQGTLALQGVAFPGALSVAAPGALSVLPAATNGLMGCYYNVAPNGSAFATLAAMEAHFAGLTPDFAAPSSLAGPFFDFGNNGALFPLPYGLGGSRTENFEAVWRGTLTAPASAWYTFLIGSDDGFLLALDGRLVVNLTYNGSNEGSVFLEAGPHDMVLGYQQVTGPYGLQVQVKTLDGNAFEMLPNAWLTPGASVGALSGNGEASLAAAGAALNVAQNSSTAFSGELAGPAGSRFTKSGWGSLTLTSASAVSNAFAGDVAVRGGVLALASAERIGDPSTAAVADGAALRLGADETLAALAGAGTVILGDSSPVYMAPFAGDADSGISTSKTYTHKLDFPATGNPANINGVAFTSAGLSGSADGYSWSTVNPPPGTWGDGGGTGVENLLWDFAYNSTDYTLTLAGLTPGQTYETRLYFRSFVDPVDPNSPRKLTFHFMAGAAYLGAVDHSPDTVARSLIGCRYTADLSGTLSVRVLSHHPGHTCHLYGLTNEKTPLVPPAVTPFTNDADSGISTSRTYTHKLDFPDNGNPATINGVAFIAAGMSGSDGGYSWDTVNPPTGAWNDPANDGTREGVDRLLWDFYYGSTDYTVTLSGLHPGQSYEACLYFRSFGGVGTDTTRDVTISFTAGAGFFGAVEHDLDTLARSRVSCRYTADAAGTLAIRVASHSGNDTCHLYGLSNAEADAPALAAWPVLTLKAPAGRAARHTGALTGFGTLVKTGEGTQLFGGANNIGSPLAVRAGTAVFEPGASVRSGVAVQAGATAAAPNGGVLLGGVEGEGTLSLAYPTANTASIVFFLNDAGTGISTNKVYTHKLDFGARSPSATINGVAFDKVTTPAGDIGGRGWVNFPPASHGGNGPPLVPAGSGVYDLLFDMDFGLPDPPAASLMQLTGLTPGKRYEVHFFNRSWGWGNDRTQTLTFDPDGDGPLGETVTFNPDSLNPNYLAYRYTAVSSALNITVQAKGVNQSLHLYGLSNEEVGDSPVEISTTRDWVFDGQVTGEGAWAKTGPAAFTVTGESTATGPLAVNAGAFGVAGGGCATLGPVSVAEGATLFGDGRLGGDVTVASNAWLRAGTAAACGTLRVGGALALAQGARLAYRFDAASGDDTVIVDGRLTFPASGVVQASALTPGTDSPTFDVFFSSAQAIDGPADLTGWSVEGAKNARLKYSGDRKAICFITPRGMIIRIR